MKFLDRVAFNRTIAILLGFIVSLIKIFMPNKSNVVDDIVPVPPIKKRGRPRKNKNNE